jgi:hypothetical protein
VLSARLCASYEKHGGKDFVPFGYPRWADLKGKEVIFGAFFMRSRGHPAVPVGYQVLSETAGAIWVSAQRLNRKACTDG